MRKKQVLITALLLLSIIINVAPVFAEQYNSTVPPMLQDLKAEDELVGYFNEIKDIRKNISTIHINSLTAKENAAELKKEISFYLTQLSEIELKISDFNKRFKNSNPDLLFAQQLSLIVETYEMSLNEQLALVSALIDGNADASTLFDSKYLTYIYYYINLGDQMSSYIDTFYFL